MQDGVCVLPGFAFVISYSGAVAPSLSASTTVPALTMLLSLSAWLVKAENEPTPATVPTTPRTSSVLRTFRVRLIASRPFCASGHRAGSHP